MYCPSGAIHNLGGTHQGKFCHTLNWLLVFKLISVLFHTILTHIPRLTLPCLLFPSFSSPPECWHKPWYTWIPGIFNYDHPNIWINKYEMFSPSTWCDTLLSQGILDWDGVCLSCPYRIDNLLGMTWTATSYSATMLAYSHHGNLACLD